MIDEWPGQQALPDELLVWLHQFVLVQFAYSEYSNATG